MPSSSYWSIIRKRYELAIFLFISVLVCECGGVALLLFLFLCFLVCSSFLIHTCWLHEWCVFDTYSSRIQTEFVWPLDRPCKAQTHTHHQPKTICKCVCVCMYCTRGNEVKLATNEFQFLTQNSYNCPAIVRIYIYWIVMPYDRLRLKKRIQSHQISINISINRTECLHFFMCLFLFVDCRSDCEFYERQITNPIRDAHKYKQRGRSKLR